MRVYLCLQEPKETPPKEGTTQEAPPQEAPAASGLGLMQFLPFIAIFVLFYFILIRPQRKQQKDREALLSQVKKNDHVLTSGGILGIVDKVKDDEVVLKVDENSDVRIRVARSAIADIKKVSGAVEGEKK